MIRYHHYEIDNNEIMKENRLSFEFDTPGKMVTNLCLKVLLQLYFWCYRIRHHHYEINNNENMKENRLSLIPQAKFNWYKILSRNTEHLYDDRFCCKYILVYNNIISNKRNSVVINVFNYIHLYQVTRLIILLSPECKMTIFPMHPD